MADVVRRDHVDLIHSHLPDHNFYSCLAGRWTNRPTIATYHGAVELTRQIRTRDAFKRWVVQKTANKVVVVCDHVGQMLKDAGFPAEKIVRIYNGIQASDFAGSASGRLREELGCSQDAKLVGTIANIRQSKGYEYFIPAARIVANSHSNVMFVAVGDDNEQIGPGLHSLVNKLDLQNNFRFLGFRSDIPQILKQLDVFVLSSTSEGFPLVVLEAMAAGKPVVVTRCGGPEEVIEDGHEGFLVLPGDPEALAGKVSDLLKDPQLGATLGANGRSKGAKQFSLQEMVKEHERLYDRVLQTP